MNSSPQRASRPAGKNRQKGIALDLPTARQMLPYVQSIVTEVVNTTKALTQLTPVQDVLDDSRRTLNWTNRQRRYAIQDEVQKAEENLAAAVSELDALGLTLADPAHGAVDFPTRINDRPAAFTWRLGEDSLHFWHYQDEEHHRPIPVDWLSGGTLNRHRTQP